MSTPLNVMLLSHGFPPRETAGTERHTEALASALRSRGHQVTVVAATRSPGAPQYSRETSPGLIRIVNNVATRALADGESDPNIDASLAEIEADLRPDVVHAHHLQFLSSTAQMTAPTVVTLHDEWAWCPSGGLGLRDGNHICNGPVPSDCSPCHASWRPRPSQSARLLTKGAGILAPLIAPHKLHSLYKRIPASLRPNPIDRGESPETADAAAYRNDRVMAWFASADVRIAPSVHLQKKAQAMGLPPVQVIRHGLSSDWFKDSPFNGPRKGLVSIGTIAYHKGTDRVVEAWRNAFATQNTPLTLHGPILDAEASLGHPVGPILSPAQVHQTLSQSRAMIMGSRWPENAPLIILEARASGCPVIAPNLGGISELVVDGVDGFLFDSDDPKGIETALLRLDASGPLNPRPPPRFDDAVDEIETIYHQLVRNRSCA